MTTTTKKTKRRRSDPQATRYRVAVRALANAEKRKAAAEKSIAVLRRKIRGYERRLTPERLTEIAAGTIKATADKKMRRDRWKAADATLRAAQRVVLSLIADPVHRGQVYTLRTLVGDRRYALVVEMPARQCLVWHSRAGFMSGAWDDRTRLNRLTRIAPPLPWEDAA